MPLLPGRPLVLIAIAPLVVALFSLADRTLLWPMLTCDLAITFVAAVDALLCWRPLVTVKRHGRNVLSIGRPNLIRLDLRSRAKRKLKVLVRDDLFDGAVADDLPVEVNLDAHGRATASYHIRPHRRGAYALGDHHVRYRSPLGLWIRQQKLSATMTVKVFPDIQAVRVYELLARQNREQSMVRSTRRRGGESEFERLREYRPEDEFRAIDWKATARHHKLIAREYQIESNQNLMFVLDAGRLMTAETAGLSLFDHALNATLMLSHVATRNGDQVGLMAFADDIKSYTAPAGGHHATRQIVHAGYHLHPDLVESNYHAAYEQLSARLRKRSMVVLFTQVVDEVAAHELLRLTRGLLPRHLALIVMFRDADVDALLHPQLTTSESAPSNNLPLYVRAAAAEVVSWRDRLCLDLKKQGALILDVLPGSLTPALINRYLEIKARHLL